ncbi:MAG: DUF438 domain-containing protein [Lactimicrobium sp.]|uniref:DUF438 domain-containing protein n=1 Tax=Lactimicrobium sp. TaxID=2563780 RepID=UPI002F35418C
MAKEIDLSKSVYDLTNEYPELIDIMAQLGFSDIVNPVMRRSAGRLMTIPKGASMKGIDMAKVVGVLMQNGFTLAGEMPDIGVVQSAKKNEKNSESTDDSDARMSLLKSYLQRLADGEDLESVRKDFVDNFKDVDASEIMKAEQELIKEGTPLNQVQKLCDVHSALFHGATREEQIANAEKAVQASVAGAGMDRKAKAAALEAVVGHPLYTFTKENEALSALLDAYDKSHDALLLPKIREVSIHYAKKGDLLYPHLKVRYGVTGPSDVMWTVDDEIRDELGALARNDNHDAAWQQRLDAVLTRVREMIFKEQNILFPIAAEKFTEADWAAVYQGSKDYDMCFGVANEIWLPGEQKAAEKEGKDGDIQLAGGHMSAAQLSAMLNTMPLEISFVDADNINRYFNEGHKLFKRPAMAIDREVFTCHPPKVEPMVRAIINDFRSGAQDKVNVWMNKNGRSVLVSYMAVRDHDGNYIGALELVQDMEFAKEHFARSAQ